jgi:hypothetical protein
MGKFHGHVGTVVIPDIASIVALVYADTWCRDETTNQELVIIPALQRAQSSLDQAA